MSKSSCHRFWGSCSGSAVVVGSPILVVMQHLLDMLHTDVGHVLLVCVGALLFSLLLGLTGNPVSQMLNRSANLLYVSGLSRLDGDLRV
jgi:hypothetical protein